MQRAGHALCFETSQCSSCPWGCHGGQQSLVLVLGSLAEPLSSKHLPKASLCQCVAPKLPSREDEGGAEIEWGRRMNPSNVCKHQKKQRSYWYMRFRFLGASFAKNDGE